jgi:hypothetical protein
LTSQVPEEFRPYRDLLITLSNPIQMEHLGNTSVVEHIEVFALKVYT